MKFIDPSIKVVNSVDVNQLIIDKRWTIVIDSHHWDTSTGLPTRKFVHTFFNTDFKFDKYTITSHQIIETSNM